MPVPVTVGLGCAAAVGLPVVILSWLPLWVVLFHLVALTFWVSVALLLQPRSRRRPRRVALIWTLPAVMLGVVLIWHFFDRDDYQLWLVSKLLFIELAEWCYQEFIAT